jgi:uracil-DNA glycosylase
MLGRTRLKGVLGRLIERDGRRYFVTYHPAASTRFPAARRLSRQHFRQLAASAASPCPD